MHVRIITALFALVLAAASSAPPSIPNTPAGHTFAAWLAAFDSGNVKTYAAFKQKYGHGADRQLLAQYEQFYSMTGGFDLRQVTASTPYSLTALMQERHSDNFARITVTVEKAPPYRMLPAPIDQVPRPAAFAIPRLTQQQLIAQVRERLAAQSAQGTFSGAVLVAKNGTPVFAQAYGLADRAHNVPNTLDTKFRIGSMNKMFTATAIMQLVQAGKVDLDKPFGMYVTDYPNKTVSSSVTIRELLTHTGGTGDIFGPEFEKNRLKLRTVQDYLDLYGHRPLAFKPGSKFEYSNYGFILLGAVIERVSGQSYYDYVRDHVFAPAGMTSTGSEPEDAPVSNRSIGYTQGPDGQWMPNTDMLPYRGSPAGGGYSTVGDLLRFANALQQHTLLNAHFTDLMTTGKVAMGPGLKYGFGFGDQIVNGTRCFGHNGGAPGMNGDLEICPQAGYTVIALSNLDPPAAGRIAEFIENRLPAAP
jgi:D-alanyl-D-alanine carboxypeptidase